MYGSFGFGLTFGGFTSFAGFDPIHLRVRQKPKKLRSIASSLVHVFAEMARLFLTRSMVSISTSSRVVMPAAFVIRRKLSSARR